MKTTIMRLRGQIEVLSLDIPVVSMAFSLPPKPPCSKLRLSPKSAILTVLSWNIRRMKDALRSRREEEVLGIVVRTRAWRRRLNRTSLG